MVAVTTRYATAPDLLRILREQHDAKLDAVIPASKIYATDAGLIAIDGMEPTLLPSGVVDTDGLYRPTAVFDEGVAEKLSIPIRYVRRMHDERPHLWAANVNEWLHGTSGDPTVPVMFEPDPRAFLFRAFAGQPEGVARALLSDKYARIDNLDVLVAALDGVKRAGVEIDIQSADLSERSMYVRLTAPGVIHEAESLLQGYRSPFSDPAIGAERTALGFPAQANFGYGPVDDPVIFAGLEIRNSETGGSAFTITPRMVARVCTNGMTITKDQTRSVHLGGKLEEGVVSWSAETHQKALELIASKTADAVQTFLDADYLREVVEDLEVKAGARVRKPQEAVKVLGQKLGYDEQTQAGILEHFMLGGQPTAGGVMQAVTSYAQLIPDADKARTVEASAVAALEMAYAL